jgi:hypothetical protein
MKGIADVEFILSTMIFLGIITFVTFSIVSNVPGLRDTSMTETLHVRTFEVSQLLLFDKGLSCDTSNVCSTDWYSAPPTDVNRMGLSTGERYVLDKRKIAAMQAACNTDYKSIRAVFGDKIFDLRLNITDSSDNQLLSCGPPLIRTSRSETKITRFAVLFDPAVPQNRDIVKLEVNVL